jgi:hypothetical protein
MVARVRQAGAPVQDPHYNSGRHDVKSPGVAKLRRDGRVQAIGRIAVDQRQQGSLSGMEQQIAAAHDIFPHVRIVMGMVVGLGVARLLSGVARIIQHPTQYPLYPVHLAWVLSVLLLLAHFWWWEFDLFHLEHWTFGKYLFLIGYAVTLFLLCALLFPDSMLDYRGYEDFFYARRGWFFGLLALSYALDIIDTLLKGRIYFSNLGTEYILRSPVFIVLCVAAILIRDRRFHIAFVTLTLVYQISFILRFYDTIA